MLIHATPELYLPMHTPFPITEVVLFGFRIEELGVELDQCRLAVGHVWPNQRYFCGRRKVGRRVVQGLMFETLGHVNAFRVEARWLINDMHMLTHIVEHQVLDSEFEAVTDFMRLWHRQYGTSFDARLPLDYVDPHHGPRMELCADTESGDTLYSTRQIDRHVDVTSSGLITHRTEVFKQHTVERPRLLSEVAIRDRLPLESTIQRCDAWVAKEMHRTIESSMAEAQLAAASLARPRRAAV